MVRHRILIPAFIGSTPISPVVLFVRIFSKRSGKSMQFCKDCNTKMVSVISFSKEKNEKFNKCPNCHLETRHHKIKDKDLNFGEVLDTEIRKRK